jgi:hypothetical protein
MHVGKISNNFYRLRQFTDERWNRNDLVATRQLRPPQQINNLNLLLPG